MHVDPRDGTCRSCQGTLTIVDADDAAITVVCDECGEVCVLETDAFNDGSQTYYLGFAATRPAERGD